MCMCEREREIGSPVPKVWYTYFICIHDLYFHSNTQEQTSNTRSSHLVF